jgi:hypothetical protein
MFPVNVLKYAPLKQWRKVSFWEHENCVTWITIKAKTQLHQSELMSVVGFCSDFSIIVSCFTQVDYSANNFESEITLVLAPGLQATACDDYSPLYECFSRKEQKAHAQVRPKIIDC